MSHTDVEAFTQQWSKFVTKVKGKLLKETKKQPLDIDIATEVLTDAKACWGSSYEASGRWLNDYSDKDYKKGKKIHDILLYEMCFEEIKPKKNLLLLLLYLITLACAGAGFLIAMFITPDWTIRIISGVIPAVLSVFTIRMIITNILIKRKKKLLADYIAQLDDFSEQIIETINS